ncbi:MAG: hypothetical protein IKC26_11035 [Clostridia bacterium]|nr:hypothetical protein [Clostridia bacterium]MBR2908560.1 hypothetical protein [Clostridia bacterium]
MYILLSGKREGKEEGINPKNENVRKKIGLFHKMRKQEKIIYGNRASPVS